MIIFPAIDVLNQKCVRLLKGELDNPTIYYDDPLEPALNFESLGFTHLHLVDLDGARTGKPANLSVLKRICENTSLKVQFGGGLRTLESIEEVFKLGADRVVLGTALVANPELAKDVVKKFGSERVVAAVDTRKGKVAIEGWQKEASLELVNLVKKLEELEVGHLLVTDVEQDGTLQGVNFELVEKILSITNLPLIISGGVSSLEDLKKAKELEEKGVEGVIIGKAIYEEKIDLKEAVKLNHVN